jgi:cyclopropane-fatty-acyl-phospholipid synthase
MAERAQVEPFYNFIDELWRSTFGQHADFSNALYRGDFSKSLEEAQADKHRYVLNAINFAPGHRVIDIGCGWGAILRVVRQAGGTAVGLTLSTRQAEACRRAGLEARVLDWREASAAELGTFDSVVSLGAFEHFCSVEEYRSGRQADVYKNFFRLCHELLRDHGRIYLQTMLWTEKTPDYETISLAAPKDTPEYMFAVIERVLPDSCFPMSLGQLERTSSPYFVMVSHENGRLDYVETLEVWRRRMRKLYISKAWLYARLVRQALKEHELRSKWAMINRPYFSECFRLGLMDHERIVFEKTSTP